MEIKRRPFQGVLQILSFNRHFYVFGFILLALLMGMSYATPLSNRFFWVLVSAFAYTLLVPLAVSAYVYDLSGFYTFDWLKKMNLPDGKNTCNVNIHAGFDETSFILKSLFPESHLQVYDFYDAKQHTEPAIVRARKASVAYPNTQTITTHSIPLNDHSVDHLFLLTALHEIRRYDEKVLFLKECRRVCKHGGHIILVEHLRDLPNFAAFTIGFMHFFSQSSWKKSLKEAGFVSCEETKFTPFMSVFHCR
jgi:SAM-dependent methyltransferase